MSFYGSLKANSLVLTTTLCSVAIALFLLTLINVNHNSAQDLKDNTKTLQGITNLQTRIVRTQETLICMSLVPQEQRTTEVANNCRKQAEQNVPDQATPTIQKPASAATSAPSQPSQSPSPSPQSTPAPPPQPSTIQRVQNTLGNIVDDLNPFN